MKSSARFQVLQGMNDRNGARATAPRAPYELRRAAVLSYEQLTRGTEPVREVAHPMAVMPSPGVRSQTPPRISAVALARDPLAHPFAPARPQRAARPFYIVDEAIDDKLFRPAAAQAAPVESKSKAPTAKNPEALVVEPVEPEAEPRHRGSLHGGVENPVRSTLSPSQRAALKRPASLLDRNRQPTYVTHTVETPSRN